MSSFRLGLQTIRLASSSSSRPITSTLLQRSSHATSSFHTTAARWALSESARKKIDDAIKAHPVVVFMKGTPESPMCGFSRGVIQVLSMQGVDAAKMKTYNCLDDQELREGIKEYSSWPTIPQVYINGEFNGGFDIMKSMYESGELQQMLKDANVVVQTA